MCLDLGMSYIHAVKCGCEACVEIKTSIENSFKEKQKFLDLAIAFAKASPIIKFRAICEKWGQIQVENAVFNGIVPIHTKRALHQIH